MLGMQNLSGNYHHVCSSLSLPTEKLKVVQNKIEYLPEACMINWSHVNYAFPIHLASRRDLGKFLLTGDYHVLNHQTIPEWCPTSYIQS